VTKNCGRKSIFELRDFIAECASDDDRRKLAEFINASKKNEERKQTSKTIYVPQEARGLPLSSFTFSTRLTNILQNFDFRLLGDLHDFEYDNFQNLENCGGKTVSELKGFIERIQSEDFQTQSGASKIILTPQELDLARFIEFIDEFAKELLPRDLDVLCLRFGASGESPLTLEEIGEKYNVSRERIRQIQSNVVKNLKERLSDAGTVLFEQIRRDCFENLCPLTPQLLIYWTKKDAADFSFAASFYVRLLSELVPEIPTLAEGQIIQTQPRNSSASRICQAIKNLLSRHFEAVSLIEIFRQLKDSGKDLSEREFLDALRNSLFFVLTFDAPDKPAIKLTAKRRVGEIANNILSESERSLAPEEIIERAKEKFGEDCVNFSPFTLLNLPLYDKDFYLLDRRAIGLRKHFQLPPERWNEMRDDFYKLLNERKRPFSTTEVVTEKIFDWAFQTNASEAAQILREDKRFTDLRRFHFALAEWQMQERGFLRDSIILTLEQAGHPLTATELLEELQKTRSVTATTLSTILNQTEEVQVLGYGFYGLRIWGDATREFLLSNRVFVHRVVSRCEPPLTFSDLCRKLEVGENEFLAERLWRTLQTSPKIKIKPNNQSPEAVLVHTNWRFERAIQKVLAQAERPLSVYEIQWELSRIFGATFDDKKLDQIRNCLQTGELFVSNPQGAFLLNEQIDGDEIGAGWIRFACQEILKEATAVLSADDLLEELEAEEIVDDNLSAEMLAVILRGDAAFEEIGMNLFRTKK
jgi:hypothetical protein